MTDKSMQIEDTITLETLYALFKKIRKTAFSSSIVIRTDFTATPEMLYNCFQKELDVHSRIGMN